MSQLLDTDLQHGIYNETLRLLRLQNEAFIETQREMQRPSVIFMPRLYPDGNKWCALYGEDLQSGVSAFGKTPDEAMRAFDHAWMNDNAFT